MVFRMPAFAGMTDILNRSVRIPSADVRIRGDDRHYWQIRMLIVHNQVNLNKTRMKRMLGFFLMFDF